MHAALLSVVWRSAGLRRRVTARDWEAALARHLAEKHGAAEGEDGAPQEDGGRSSTSPTAAPCSSARRRASAASGAGEEEGGRRGAEEEPPGPAQPAAAAAAAEEGERKLGDMLRDKGWAGLGIRERVALLRVLMHEALDSSALREHMEAAAEVLAHSPTHHHLLYRQR